MRLISHVGYETTELEPILPEHDLSRPDWDLVCLRSKQKQAQTTTNRGKPCEAPMINYGELINYIEQGWEILRDIGLVRVGSVGVNLCGSLWEVFE